MTDATAAFFDELSRRGHERLLEKANGTACFELADGDHTDHWVVTITKGDIAVRRADGEADCVVRAERSLFNGIASGETNALAALIRGALHVEGDPELLVLFQRLFPGPPSSRHRQPIAGGMRR
jgi:putative sterol carrier protein